MESELQKGAFSLALVALLLTLTTAQQRMYTTRIHIFSNYYQTTHIYFDTSGTLNPRSIYINLVVVPIIIALKRSCGKIMFSQASVSVLVEGLCPGRGSLSYSWECPDRGCLCNRDPHYTSTTMASMHPTGMHSCWFDNPLWSLAKGLLLLLERGHKYLQSKKGH